MDLLQGESLRVMEDFVGMLASLISTTAMVFVDDIMSDSCRNVAGGSENGLGFGGRCAGQLFVGCNFGLGNELLVVRRQAPRAAWGGVRAPFLPLLLFFYKNLFYLI